MTEVIEVEDCGENIGDYDIPIHNAIIIPRGVTNGDVIKVMFPNGKEYDNDGDVRYEIEIDFDYSFCSYFDGVWWNAPYKGNLSEKPTGSEREDV